MITLNAYGSRTVGLAETELGRQLGSTEIEAGINLSLIWREAASPFGLDPQSWISTDALDLVSAFARYSQAIYPQKWHVVSDEACNTSWEHAVGVIDVWSGDVGSWDRGDLTTRSIPLALAYALYLDVD